jgi:hypothetical protein
MTASYDSSLRSEKDWVRMMIGDDDPATATLQDEEIDALLVEEANKYLAAAAALCVLQGRWASAGEGILEKQVDTLRIKWGVDPAATNVLTARIKELKRKGVDLVTPEPRMLGMI